jgi:hypothetical protein
VSLVEKLKLFEKRSRFKVSSEGHPAPFNTQPQELYKGLLGISEKNSKLSFLVLTKKGVLVILD